MTDFFLTLCDFTPAESVAADSVETSHKTSAVLSCVEKVIKYRKK